MKLRKILKSMWLTTATPSKMQRPALDSLIKTAFGRFFYACNHQKGDERGRVVTMAAFE